MNHIKKYILYCIGGHTSELYQVLYTRYIWLQLDRHKSETIDLKLAHIRVKHFYMYFSLLVLN